MTDGGDDDEGGGNEGDDLYGLDPAGFIAARNALVKQLKVSGQREQAATVAALRRPPATAWALNQVARTEPTLVDDALAAGALLRRATDAALAGDVDGLRDASVAERSASAGLVDAAADLLGVGGQQAKARMAATVRAAVLDEVVADELRRGVLSADHDRSGLGLDPDDESVAAPPGRHLRVVRTRGEARTRRERAGTPTGDDATQGGPTTDGATDRAASHPVEPSPARTEPEAAKATGTDRPRVAEQRAHRRRLHELRSLADRAAKRADRLGRDADAAEEVATLARSEAEEAAEAAADAARNLAEAQADPLG